jgi:hypothetical protein
MGLREAVVDLTVVEAGSGNGNASDYFSGNVADA